jgi:hypothetical protein
MVIPMTLSEIIEGLDKIHARVEGAHHLAGFMSDRLRIYGLDTSKLKIETACEALCDTIRREFERQPLDYGDYKITGNLEIRNEGSEGFSGFTSVSFTAKN